MSRRRKFTPAFKAQVVLELLSGTKSRAELCRQHQLSSHLLARWKATFEAEIVKKAASIVQTPLSGDRR
jgi:transposase-like protein